MPRSAIPTFATALLLILAGPAFPQEAEAPPPPAEEVEHDHAEAPAHSHSGRTFEGRPIADVMSYLGADWLFRPEREVEERPEAMLDALEIRPGDVVADVGAGAGYTSLRLARRVGPTGKVLATDVQPQMLRMLAARAKAAGASNVRPILCTPTDPKLPPGAVDLVLMVDVYHECSAPEATLRGLRAALKPGGRLVLVEFRGEDPNVPIYAEHKMTVAQVRREIEPRGFVFKRVYDFLPWQHIIVFEKPAEGPAEPASK